MFPAEGTVTSSINCWAARAYHSDASTRSAGSRPPGHSTRSMSQNACRSSGYRTRRSAAIRSLGRAMVWVEGGGHGGGKGARVYGPAYWGWGGLGVVEAEQRQRFIQ